MSIVIVTMRDTCGVAAGNQDYTTPNLGGLTPVGVWFTVVYGISDGGPADNAVMGMGAATSVSDQWAFCTFCQHNVNPTNTGRRGVQDQCIMVLDPATGNVDGEAAFVSFIPGGVRVNWGNACSLPFLLVIDFFAGTDMSAHADVFIAANLVNTSVNVVDPGFEPDVILFAFGADEMDDTTKAEAFFNHGMAVNKDSIVQASWNFRSRDNQATAQTAGQITDNYIGGPVTWWDGTFNWALEITAFGAAGFTCTTRVAATGGNDDVGYLALNLNGAADFNGGIIASPIANGNHSWNDPGLEPDWVHLGLTEFQAIDTGYDRVAASGTYGASSFDADSEYCSSFQDEDGVGPSDTQSLNDNVAVNLPDDDGAVAWVASFVTFHALGWTLNFTQSKGTAVYWWYVSIGVPTPPVPPPVPPVEVYVPPILPPSYAQARALSIVYSDPITKTPRAGFLGEMREKISAYQQVISAWGGYDMATIRMAATQNDADEWLEYGLCRHIEVYSPSLELIWEGMVDQVAVSLGKASITVGPALNSANRVATVYSTVDTTVSPPVFGIRTKTAVVNDTDAQARFGIIEKIYSVGGATQTDAEQIRNTYLKENAWPPTTQILGETGNETSILLTCLGYVHWFKCYVYNYTTNTGTENLSAKIQNVIAAQLNPIIRSYDLITNTLAVDRYENDDKTAWDLLKGLTAMGDANDARYLFGIYKQRKAVYKAAPTTQITYQQRLADPSQRVELLTGSEVKPWDVLPGKWLFVPDFLVGKSQPLVLRRDPRYIFIEKVTFTMPYGLNIQGGKVDTLPQKLARMGLGGVSA